MPTVLLLSCFLVAGFVGAGATVIQHQIERLDTLIPWRASIKPISIEVNASIPPISSCFAFDTGENHHKTQTVREMQTVGESVRCKPLGSKFRRDVAGLGKVHRPQCLAWVRIRSRAKPSSGTPGSKILVSLF